MVILLLECVIFFLFLCIFFVKSPFGRYEFHRNCVDFHRKKRKHKKIMHTKEDLE
jgi:hypothetical protein